LKLSIELSPQGMLIALGVLLMLGGAISNDMLLPLFAPNYGAEPSINSPVSQDRSP
jgi:hypothetical protein